MSVVQKDLDLVSQEWKHKFGGPKDDYFPLAYLSKEFRKPTDEFVHNVSIGSHPLGINAFYVDTERKNLNLYFCIWSENHNLFKDAMKLIAGEGMDKIFAPSSETLKGESQFYIHLRSSLLENQSLIQRVFLHFVFNGDPEKAEKSSAIDRLKEDIESKRHMVESYFEKEIVFTADFLSNQSRKRAGFSHSEKTHRYSFQFANPITKTTQGGQTLHLGFVSLYDLFVMYREMGFRLFERNIRAGLSQENSPNRSIRNALRDILLLKKENADEFVFHHNGVTISAQALEVLDNKANLVEPRVLNGAQTISSVAKFLEDNPSVLEKQKKQLESIQVLAKIIVSELSHNTSDFVVRVTINTNRQNPVQPWNLRASDMIQLELSDKFREELNIFYERQEKSFGVMSYEEIEELGVDAGKTIEIIKLAQTFLATQGELDKISKLKEVFENDKTYSDTFKQKYLKVDARRILLAYKVQLRLRKALDEIAQSGQKYLFISRAKNLIWALLIQGLLNDNKLDSLLENYGIQLKVEANFNEHIKTLASKKIRLIISEILSEERYAQNIREEKYSFLRTKAIYESCMKIANTKYGWTKQDF